MSTLRSDYFFNLPEELIAQVPLKDRSSSRLLVLRKDTGEILHRRFTDIVDYLGEGDVIVLNDSRVLPARLFGNRSTGAVVEFLLLKRTELDTWECLVKPGKKARIGDEFTFGDGRLRATVVDYGPEGSRLVTFHYEGVFEELLDELGSMPLPPYIREKLEDKERYQTVYSRVTGSAAAPTAGLHFTDELMESLRSKGVHVEFVTLHVGLGTFRPVKADNILDHSMHSEYYEINGDTIEAIKTAKKNGRKVVTVGTTSTRAIETVFSKLEEGETVDSASGWTDIFIYPGYTFKAVDGLITNFHLPESTLIMLVSALAGRESTLWAYDEAVRDKYRFFSFGDAMLIV
jgi:S-adenosylmethionine:tRNA ribosyltransferase-isomerase